MDLTFTAVDQRSPTITLLGPCTLIMDMAGANTVLLQANGSAANQIDYVCGQAEDAVTAAYDVDVYNDNAAGVLFVAGVGVDSTTAFSGIYPMRQNVAASRRVGAGGSYRGIPGLGYHYIAALEYSGAGTGTTTWGGDNANATLYQSGMTGEVWA